jgi:hypothetical protein
MKESQSCGPSSPLQLQHAHYHHIHHHAPIATHHTTDAIAQFQSFVGSNRAAIAHQVIYCIVMIAFPSIYPSLFVVVASHCLMTIWLLSCGCRSVCVM